MDLGCHWEVVDVFKVFYYWDVWWLVLMREDVCKICESLGEYIVLSSIAAWADCLNSSSSMPGALTAADFDVLLID